MWAEYVSFFERFQPEYPQKIKGLPTPDSNGYAATEWLPRNPASWLYAGMPSQSLVSFVTAPVC
jgi:hypothetical protein